MNLKWKSCFCGMKGAIRWMEGKNYILSIVGWDKKITFAKHLICSRFIFNIISFSPHRISKWLGRYYSHFSDETESWNDSLIITWLLQRWACIWSQVRLSGSYIQVLFMTPNNLLLLWLFLSFSAMSVNFYFTLLIEKAHKP